MSPLMLTVAGFLAFAITTGLAIYSTYDRHRLSLPTPILAHILGIAIPLLNVLVAYGAGRGGPKRSLPFAIPSPLALLAILDAILLTLTAADFRPLVRSCMLETHWHTLFKAKDAATIKRIQDVLDCCGLRSVVNEAWPLPGGDRGANACVLKTGRTSPCEPGLVRREKSAMGILLAIAIVGLVGKALIRVLARERSAWLPTEDAAPGRATSHRITDVEDTPNETGRYIDNPREAPLGEQDRADGRHVEQLI